MCKIILIFILVFVNLAGCGIYKGVITAPDGKKYIVEQNKPGTIEMEDGNIRIKAGTQAESKIDKLIDLLLLREIRQPD